MLQIDHSIVESFGGKGKECITARVYPTLAVDGDTHLYAFNYGSESVKIAGSAWSMKTAQINWSRLEKEVEKRSGEVVLIIVCDSSTYGVS